MNTTIMTRVFVYIAKYKKYMIISIFSAIVSVIASLLGPMFIGRAVDYMVGSNQVDFVSIQWILVLLVLVYSVNSLFGWSLTYFTNKVSYQTVNAMRHELFAKINRLSLEFYDGNSHGDIVSRFVNDIDIISDGMVQGIANMLMGIITIFGAIGFMLYISASMTLVVILSAPAAYFVARFITKRSQKLFKAQAKCLGVLNGYAEEVISEQKLVKAFTYEERSFAQFKKMNDELYQMGVKSQFYGSLTNPTTRLVNNITYGVIGVIGSVLAVSGKITVGDIASFLIYSNLFAKPFNDITGIFTQIQSALASAQRVFHILDLKEEVQDAASALQLERSQGNITFQKVDFSYTKENPLIRDFNLTVKPGTHIAIVGHTGAGKTTLVNLLMRFYEINQGSIAIDGVDIKDITRDSLRRNFGMVLQDTWLFAGTIRENIAYGVETASEAEVIAAGKASDAHSFIRRLPKGYDTLITDKGANLSQGQKQLLTIARVMLVNPAMLILDEATSSIDTRTELRIQKAFTKMLEGRTSFVIAHRLSTIKEADVILVMDKGSIVEKGKHKELLRKNGTYAQLYNSQFSHEAVI
ncbi:MAG: ABC transporter ATP-binding protein [Selenomonadaceae bacterium]